MMRIGIISGDETLHAPAVRYLSSYLKKGGHPVELLFMRKRAATTPTPHLPDDFHSYSAEQLDAARRWAGKFDLLGLTCISLNAPRTRQLAVALSGGAPVVWGGAHATTSSEECLAQSDMVCRGEGEEAFLELANALEAGKPTRDIANLWLRENGVVRRNDVRQLLPDLDALGGHDYDLRSQSLLDGNRIRNAEEKDLGSVWYLNHIRGCPFKCSFCWWSFHHRLYKDKGPRFRKRSPESVAEEVSALKRRFSSLRYINFMNEDDFLYTREEAREFSLRWQEVRIPFTMQVSPLTLDREKLDAYVGAGLRSLGMGMQSGSDRMLHLYDRRMFQVDIRKAASLLKGYAGRITVVYQMLYNCSYEKEEDLRATLRLIAELPPPFELSLLNLTYLPGTTLHERAMRDGHIGEGETQRLHRHGYDLVGHLYHASYVPSPYLLFLMRSCSGRVTARRIGLIPRKLLPALSSPWLCGAFDTRPSLTAALYGGYGAARRITHRFRPPREEGR